MPRVPFQIAMVVCTVCGVFFLAVLYYCWELMTQLRVDVDSAVTGKIDASPRRRDARLLRYESARHDWKQNPAQSIRP